MLAGCSSSTLLSPRHRLPSMSTQRLDLPCSFTRKESTRSQPIRPVGLSIDKQQHQPIESKTTGGGCSLKQNIRLPPLATTGQTTVVFSEGRRDSKDEFWEKGKSLKRFAEHGLQDELCIDRVKRKRSCAGGNNGGDKGGECDDDDRLSLGQFGSDRFWFQQNFTGDEDMVCYLPNELTSPQLPTSNNPWVESVITRITNIGDKHVETTRRLVKEDSGSSASSESRRSSLGLKLHDGSISTDHETGNGSGNPNPNPWKERVGIELCREEYQALELVNLLTGCVEAIGSKNVAAINHYIAKLGDLASPRGRNVMTRLAAYYTEALALRVTRIWPHVFHINIPREYDRVDDEPGIATRFLNQVTPIPKFIHFTANEILLRAFEGKDRVHVIDFDIKQGLQWPSFFQSLASRTNPPTHVRITGVGESKQELNETGDRLTGFAESLNLSFEFHPVVDRLEDVRLWMLHVKEGESVGINSISQLHKTLYTTTAFRDFAGLIRSTNPIVVVTAEQEAEHNVENFETRVCSSLKYYSAIFDSIDSSGLPLDSPVRIKIEEMYAREVRNIVACEGSNRLERHEVFENWKKVMEQQGGFRCVGITEREFLQSQMLLKMYSFDKYNVKKKQEHVVGEGGGEGGGGAGAAAVTLSWLDQPLYTVSAWVPGDVIGGSGSFSQPI